MLLHQPSDIQAACHRRAMNDAPDATSLLEFKLLLRLLQNTRQALCEENCLCTPASRMCFDCASQLLHVGFDFDDLLGLCQSDQRSKIFPINVILAGACIFA